MAASALIQAIPANSPTRVASRTTTNRLLPAAIRLCSRRTASFRVRCTAEVPDRLATTEEPKEQSIPESIPPPSPAPQPSPAPPSPSPKASTNFRDILAFSGPAPERINGRLAMIGFVAAIAVEALKGQDLIEQIGSGGIPWFVGTSVVLSLASLVPLLKGVSVESKSKGLMTSDAELWNGRFAMMGLVALAFTEYVKGGSLV